MPTFDPDVVLAFWFEELTAADWFTGGAALDARIADRFGALHVAVVANECFSWRTDPRHALAELIVLDQFSRNIHRGTPGAFAADGQALALAQVALDREYPTTVPERERPFFYLPYMHSESPRVHEIAVGLFAELTDPEYAKQERTHKDIIDRFGRYPHRNQILGRSTTTAEQAFLADTDHNFYNA